MAPRTQPMFRDLYRQVEFAKDDAPPPGYVRLEGKIFECGDYPQKRFSLDEYEADRAIERFQPVTADLEHMPTILDGKLGVLKDIWREGTSIFGAADVPWWIADALKDTRSTMSCAWDRASKTLQGWGWVLEPAVTDAKLVGAFSAFSRTFPDEAALTADDIIHPDNTKRSITPSPTEVSESGSKSSGQAKMSGTPEQRRLRMPLIDKIKETMAKRGMAGGTVTFSDPNAPKTQPPPTMPPMPPTGQVPPTGTIGDTAAQAAKGPVPNMSGALAGVAQGDPVEVQQDDGTWRDGYVALGPVGAGSGPNNGQQTIMVCSSADFQAGQQQKGVEVPADKVRAVHPGHGDPSQSPQGADKSKGQQPTKKLPAGFALHAPGTQPESDDSEVTPEEERLARFKADAILSRAEDAAKALVAAGKLLRFGQEAATALFAQMDIDNELADPPVVTFSRADGTIVSDRVALLKELFSAVPTHALFTEGLPINVLNGNQGKVAEADTPEAQGKAQADAFNAEMVKNMPALQPNQNGNGNGNHN